jgi:hypothetical protein
MATVFVQACTTTPNTATNTYSGWCPAANRRAIAVDDVVIQGTTLEVQTTPEPIDPTRVADMQALFIAFVAVLVSVWGLKQLLRLVTSDTERD